MGDGLSSRKSNYVHVEEYQIENNMEKDSSLPQIKSVEMNQQNDQHEITSVDQDKSVSSAPASKKGKQSVPKLDFQPKTTTPDQFSPNDRLMCSMMSNIKPFSWRENDWDVRNSTFTGDVEKHLELYDFFYVNKRSVYK